MAPIAVTKTLAVALAVSLAALAYSVSKDLRQSDTKAASVVPAYCQPSSEEQDIARDEVKHYGSKNVGGMGGFEYQVTPDASSGIPEAITAHATVALWTPHGRLLGSDRGEFGGELVLSRKDSHPEPNPEIILRANIEDLFVAPYGIVVTSGLSHLSYDRGAIYLLTFADSQPHVKKIYDLPSAVKSSWHTSDGNILINTHQRGSYLIKAPTEVVTVKCPLEVL
jgi:hypothetical protein